MEPQKKERRCLICGEPVSREAMISLCQSCDEDPREDSLVVGKGFLHDRELAEDERREKRIEARWATICESQYRATVKEKLPNKAQELYDRIQNYNWRTRRGITLSGDSGAGKTRLAFLALKASFHRGARVQVLRAAEMRMKIGADWGAAEALQKSLLRVDVLLFDDVGQGAKMEQLDEISLAILEQRNRKEQPTLITTQWNSETIVERFARHETGVAFARRMGREYATQLRF